MRSISIQLSKRNYWKLAELEDLLFYIQIFICAEAGVIALFIFGFGYTLDNIRELISNLWGFDSYNFLLSTNIYLIMVALVGHTIVKMIKSMAGRCTECKHELVKHENRFGIVKNTGCDGRKPKKNSVFRTERCACMHFSQEKKPKKDFVDEETGVVVRRRDKWIVIGIWLGIVMGWRMLLIDIDPVKWIGSLGAIACSFFTIYFAFRYIKQLQKYRLMFNAVIKKWYTRRIQLVLYLYLAYNITMTLMINYGHEHYDQYILAFEKIDKGEAEQVPIENGKVAYVNATTKFKEFFENPDPPLSLWDSWSYFYAQANYQTHGLVGVSNWIFIYEEAEFIIFFIMIKKGWLFR